MNNYGHSLGYIDVYLEMIQNCFNFAVVDEKSKRMKNLKEIYGKKKNLTLWHQLDTEF